MTKCAKCGKVKWDPDGELHKIWNSTTTMTEYNGKLLCLSCSGLPMPETVPVGPAVNSGKKCTDCHFCSKTSFQKTASMTHNLTSYSFSGNLSGDTQINYEYEERWDCSKFGFRDIDYHNKAEKCTSYIDEKSYEKKCLSGEIDKEKQLAQVVLDFSSLNEALLKRGIAMTAYYCPNCNCMVDIPETDKGLNCKHCGTPTKPVNIFEKIK
jgi:hypothetical protein